MDINIIKDENKIKVKDCNYNTLYMYKDYFVFLKKCHLGNYLFISIKESDDAPTIKVLNADDVLSVCDNIQQIEVTFKFPK